MPTRGGARKRETTTAAVERVPEAFQAINESSPQGEIAQIAYRLYEERTRSGNSGSAEEDWLRAEEEFRRIRGRG
ncbi:MAG: DUF2934 domain-containing protein [Bryobacteraceae bacterium]|nr:DUF2934 domain-containing protein [Bryobacteraceae bacterium]